MMFLLNCFYTSIISLLLGLYFISASEEVIQVPYLCVQMDGRNQLIKHDKIFSSNRCAG
jgi:hypothetical protein